MKLITHCPACSEKLVIKELACPQCGLLLSRDFEGSPFDYLDDADMSFLISFLRAKGNLTLVQEEINISYPTARRRLEQLLAALHLSDNTDMEELDMENFHTMPGTEASTIVRNKLIESNGRATIYSYNGTPYEICMGKDGSSFTCAALPNVAYEFRIFDYIVDLLRRQGGKARKGQARGRNDKVGSENCNEHTVTGVIALEYYKKISAILSLTPCSYWLVFCNGAISLKTVGDILS